MKEAEANENFLKEKLSKVKCQLAGKEETIAELNSEIRQLQGDLTFQKKVGTRDGIGAQAGSNAHFGLFVALQGNDIGKEQPHGHHQKGI